MSVRNSLSEDSHFSVLVLLQVRVHDSFFFLPFSFLASRTRTMVVTHSFTVSGRLVDLVVSSLLVAVQLVRPWLTIGLQLSREPDGAIALNRAIFQSKIK